MTHTSVQLRQNVIGSKTLSPESGIRRVAWHSQVMSETTKTMFILY